MNVNLNLNTNFFNSMLGNSTKNSNTGLAGLLGDYSSIRNGSYLKLAKHYYATDGAKEATKKKFTNTDTAAFRKQTEDKVTKAGAEGAWKDINALRSDKLYKTDASDAYDTEAIGSAVSRFVKGYNGVLKSAEESDHANVQKTAAGMTAQTERYATALSKIGISVQQDHTLKFDEAAFASADMQDVKQLFAGDFSFGSNTQNTLLKLASDAGTTLSGLYTASGAATSTIGNFYDSLF